MSYRWFRTRLDGLSAEATFRIMRGELRGPGDDAIDYRKSPQDTEAELMREF